MDAPIVSVIIIFLNAEPFLAEAVESVFAQTYASWELILVDDGSSDGSTELARRWAREHPDRVRYLEHAGHENRGMSASRNVGIAAARGPYIAFLDGDDVYLPQRLERQVALLGAHPEAAMVYGPTLHWYSWQGARAAQPDWIRRLGVPADALHRPPVLAVRWLRGVALTPGIGSALVRREAIERVGGFEERFRRLYSDQPFFYKLALTAPAFVSGEHLDRYRQHGQSSVHRNAAAGSYDPDAPHPARRELLDWIDEWVRANGVDYPALRRALRVQRLAQRHALVHLLVSVPTRVRRLRRRVRHAAHRLAARVVPAWGRS